MKQYRIDTSRGEAEADMEDIFNFIALDSPPNALLWYLDLKQKIQTLQTMPERCPKAPEDELEEFTVFHLVLGNYLVLFRIEEKIVQVLHVRGKEQGATCRTDNTLISGFVKPPCAMERGSRKCHDFTH